MINDKQHGFRAERSCATNLVGLCDSLALSLNDNIRTDVIYFDFAKAFDSVNHDLILYKLKNKFGIDGRLLKFIADYLRDRQQQVLISGKLSSLRTPNLVCHRGLFWGLCYSLCLLMIYQVEYHQAQIYHFMQMILKYGARLSLSQMPLDSRGIFNTCMTSRSLIK